MPIEDKLNIAFSKYLEKCDEEVKATYRLLSYTTTAIYDVAVMAIDVEGEDPDGTLFAFFDEDDLCYLLLEYDTLLSPIYKKDAE